MELVEEKNQLPKALLWENLSTDQKNRRSENRFSNNLQQN